METFSKSVRISDSCGFCINKAKSPTRMGHKKASQPDESSAQLVCVPNCQIRDLVSCLVKQTCLYVFFVLFCLFDGL